MPNIDLVSIITPTYNSAATIAATIASVLNQTYRNWELLIVDDGSSDNTMDIVKEYQKQDSRIVLFRLEHNSGAAVARNTAIRQAKGRYIAFLDSDDKWMEDKLTQQISFMKANKADLSFTAYEKVNENFEHIEYMGAFRQINYSQLLKFNVIGCLTAVYDTKYIGKVYMPEIRTRQDYGLWLDILKNNTVVAYGLNEVLATYSVRSDSISSNKKKAAFNTFKLYRDIEKLGNVKSAYYFCQYAVRGLIRAKHPKMAIKMGFNSIPNKIHD